MNRLPASQRYKRHKDRWKRYEKALPGHRIQIDVKFVTPMSGAKRKKYYQFTAIDDCTRRILRIYDHATRRHRSSSSTMCSPNSPSKSRSFRQTMGLNSRVL